MGTFFYRQLFRWGNREVTRHGTRWRGGNDAYVRYFDTMDYIYNVVVMHVLVRGKWYGIINLWQTFKMNSFSNFYINRCVMSLYDVFVRISRIYGFSPSWVCTLILWLLIFQKKTQCREVINTYTNSWTIKWSFIETMIGTLMCVNELYWKQKVN